LPLPPSGVDARRGGGGTRRSPAGLPLRRSLRGPTEVARLVVAGYIQSVPNRTWTATALEGVRMFKRIDHIELLTAAPERTVAFYTTVLGFLERERRRIPETPSGPLDLVYLDLGGTTLEVMCYPDAGSIAPRSAEQRLGWQCLALEVDDMDAALRMLDQKGVQAAWGPVKRPDYARAEIRDPDGNPIELRQWYHP
jgi:catechol 2,3-dioxygenase-like lactoylglutathione lyase family enzyme